MMAAYLVTVVIGLALGSFVNALVWRLRQQGQREEGRGKSKKSKQSASHPSNLTPQTSNLTSEDYSILHGRSMCPDCHHQLAWYDLLPVVSWLMLKGKCRYCQKPISIQYPLVELLVAASAVLSLALWPFALATTAEWLLFVVWMVILTLLVAMAAYDLKWMILPSKLVYSFGLATVCFVVTSVVVRHDFIPLTRGVLASLCLGGFFWLTYQASKGAWIGGGDVRLGFFMGLLLGPAKTFLAVTIASYIGLAVVVLLSLRKKYKAKMKIPFGPLLIVGTYLAFLFGQNLIEAYLSITGL